MVRKEALNTKDLFLLVTYMMKRQGTDDYSDIQAGKGRFIPFKDVENTFGLSREDVTRILADLMIDLDTVQGIERPYWLELHIRPDDIAVTTGWDLPGVSGFQRLTLEEGVTLKIALMLWGRVMGGKIAMAMKDLANTIGGLVSEELAGDYAVSSGRFAIGIPLQESRNIRTLYHAIQARHSVQFDYHDPTTGNVTKGRKVDPLAVFCTSDCWYLMGWCHLRQARRTFYMEGIEKLKVLGEEFEEKRGSLQYSRSLSESPMKGAKLPVKVRLRFHPPLARWVEDNKPSTTKLKRVGDAVESIIKVRSIESMKRSLLPLGDKVEVLEPEELREGLAANAGKLVKIYKK